MWSGFSVSATRFATARSARASWTSSTFTESSPEPPNLDRRRMSFRTCDLPKCVGRLDRPRRCAWTRPRTSHGCVCPVPLQKCSQWRCPATLGEIQASRSDGERAHPREVPGGVAVRDVPRSQALTVPRTGCLGRHPHSYRQGRRRQPEDKCKWISPALPSCAVEHVLTGSVKS